MKMSSMTVAKAAVADSKVVSIGRLTAFYVVLVPMEYIPSKPLLSAYVIVSFLYLQKSSTF